MGGSGKGTPARPALGTPGSRVVGGAQVPRCQVGWTGRRAGQWVWLSWARHVLAVVQRFTARRCCCRRRGLAACNNDLGMVRDEDAITTAQLVELPDPRP